MSTYYAIAFYKFVNLPDYIDFREKLLTYCLDLEVKGSILLAEEGINGMLAGTRKQIDTVLAHLRSDPRLTDLEHKESESPNVPFRRMKVRLKSEIVKLGVKGVDPSCAVGTYINSQDWNALISDPEVLLIDTRNDFECEIGTFKGAINPHTESFSDFPEYVEKHLDPAKHKKVAMFCTGGIRCEKSTSYLLGLGFEEVYHLRGGILKYLEEIPQAESLWEGECFIFDDRVTLNHQLKPGDYDLCHGCWQPLDEAMRKSEYYEDGISCPRCGPTLTEKQRSSRRQRHDQILLARKRAKENDGITDHSKQ